MDFSYENVWGLMCGKNSPPFARANTFHISTFPTFEMKNDGK
jgi:hypothetical protein